jgi:hypothetical protein
MQSSGALRRENAKLIHLCRDTSFETPRKSAA